MYLAPHWQVDIEKLTSNMDLKHGLQMQGQALSYDTLARGHRGQQRGCQQQGHSEGVDAACMQGSGNGALDKTRADASANAKEAAEWIRDWRARCSLLLMPVMSNLFAQSMATPEQTSMPLPPFCIK